MEEEFFKFRKKCNLLEGRNLSNLENPNHLEGGDVLWEGGDVLWEGGDVLWEGGDVLWEGGVRVRIQRESF